jgi:hypothetical protein
MNRSDDFEIGALQIDPTDPTLVPARGRARADDHKARRYFIKVPLIWAQRLTGAPGQTYALALHILFLHFRERGAAITLANRAIKRDGIPSQSKRRALRDLERRGLVSVDWRSKRSPIVKALIG